MYNEVTLLIWSVRNETHVYSKDKKPWTEQNAFVKYYAPVDNTV